jgi:serine/threonine-protein kinase RsbW
MSALNRVVCWEDSDNIGIAIGEALANAIVHGNHCDPRKKVRISVALNENCDLLVSVKDSGSGFDPSVLPDPIVAENLLAKRGRGLFLIRHFMDQVEFNFDRGTEVRMRRRQQWLE